MGRSRSILALYAAVALVLVPLCVGAQGTTSTTQGDTPHEAFEPAPANSGANSAAPTVVRRRASGKQNRIIGGVADFTSFPWIVNIYKIGNQEVQCTGSLIGGRWVLTASHCFHDSGAAQGFYLPVNSANTEVKVSCAQGSSSSCTVRRVVRAVHHPCYLFATGENDITLLELDSTAGMPATLGAIDNVNGTASATVGQQISLAGFGVTNASDPLAPASADMMRVTNVITSKAYCEQQNPTFKNAQDFDLLICTNSTQVGGGQDSCQGDSGGPVIKRIGTTDWIIGISSFGSELPSSTTACGVDGRVSVNTRIEKYADFIYKTMTGATYACGACPCASSSNYYSSTPAPAGSTTVSDQCQEYTTAVNTGVCAGYSFKAKMCMKPGQTVADAETQASTAADDSAGTASTCSLISKADCGQDSELMANYCTVKTGSYCSSAFREELLRTKGCETSDECNTDGVLKAPKKICCTALINQLMKKCLFTSETLDQKMVEKRNSGACDDFNCWTPPDFVAPGAIPDSAGGLRGSVALAVLAGYLSLLVAALRV